MESTNIRSRKSALTIAAVIVSIFTWLGLSVNTPMAQGDTTTASREGGSDPKARQHRAAQRTWEVTKRTQAGARINFSSLKDWNLKAENISPRGHNPLYFPLKPGFKFIMEYPDHPWGFYRKEVVVLEKTEPFDVPGIGKFECAVIQEEEFFDGVYDQQSRNWFAIDKTTNSMYAFGEVSWEIDQIGRKVFAGTWRVGEPDGNGVAGKIGGGQIEPHSEIGLNARQLGTEGEMRRPRVALAIGFWCCSLFLRYRNAAQ